MFHDIPTSFAQFTLKEKETYLLNIVEMSQNVQHLKEQVITGDLHAWDKLLYNHLLPIIKRHYYKRKRKLSFEQMQRYVFSHISPKICTETDEEIVLTIQGLMSRAYQQTIYFTNISQYVIICFCGAYCGGFCGAYCGDR
jgi:hypothetical protein